MFTVLDTSRLTKEFGDCENIPSVNPLCLIICSATGHFKEKKTKNA